MIYQYLFYPLRKAYLSSKYCLISYINCFMWLGPFVIIWFPLPLLFNSIANCSDTWLKGKIRVNYPFSSRSNRFLSKSCLCLSVTFTTIFFSGTSRGFSDLTTGSTSVAGLRGLRSLIMPGSTTRLFLGTF